MTTSRWTADHVAAIDAATRNDVGVFGRDDVQPIVPGIDLWDFWPVQTPGGAVADIAGGTLWMALSAPAIGVPDHRHLYARIRLLHRIEGRWRDLGALLPNGFGPGNREWSGSAIIEDERRVRLFFTAAGIAGRKAGWQQRLYQTQADLQVQDGTPRLANWSRPIESVQSDGADYLVVDAVDGAPGQVKAFRDPAYFRDPADGASYLLFAASLAASGHSHNGCIGLARAEAGSDDSAWQLLPPLIDANGLSNELERPHMLVKDGLYYLFWSTQQSVFAPDGPAGPTGLYGMVADTLGGPYAPLNGTGLIFANPTAEPRQAYSWQVLDDLSVTSFVDVWGTGGRAIKRAYEARAHFGGTFAPLQQIGLDGARATLISSAGGPA